MPLLIQGGVVAIHKNISEYNGVYTCHDCGARWGDIPGEPDEPKKCIDTKPNKIRSFFAKLIK